jgi:hypothetical protein
MHGYTQLDFDFFIVLARHTRLPLRHAMLLLHLLGKVSLNDLNGPYAKLASVPFLILIDRFHTEKPLQDYVEKYIKVCLSVIMKAAQAMAQATTGRFVCNMSVTIALSRR